MNKEKTNCSCEKDLFIKEYKRLQNVPEDERISLINEIKEYMKRLAYLQQDEK
jgi:hypothetical protein